MFVSYLSHVTSFQVSILEHSCCRLSRRSTLTSFNFCTRKLVQTCQTDGLMDRRKNPDVGRFRFYKITRYDSAMIDF